DVCAVVAEPQRRHLCDRHTAVPYLALARLEPCPVLERDRDRGTVLVDPVVHEIGRDRGGDQGHDPHDVDGPPPPAAGPPPGRRLGGRRVVVVPLRHRRASPLSQMSRGSKLDDARMVSTATAMKEKSPGPGTTVASSPSFTRATSTDITNTSSIAHGPMSSSA